MKAFVNFQKLKELVSAAGRPQFWRSFFAKPSDGITLVLLTKQHLEVQKIKLSATSLRWIKVGSFFVVFLSLLSLVFLVDYLTNLPHQALVVAENKALRKELDRLQFHMDTLQTSMDRIQRFDQKLRALTEVDKKFAKKLNVKGQGGGETELFADLEFDPSNMPSEQTNFQMDPESDQMLDRRQAFLVARLYAWMRDMVSTTALREQSVEELFEVLKGREIQLAATPSILPVAGWVTSHFGYRMDPFTDQRRFHRGVDVAARLGAPVVSPAEGVVTFAGPNGGFGRTVMLFHGYGVSTLYGHMNDIYVKEGERVSRGALIGSVGNTGRSTAAHLHYEVTVHGVHVDPRKFILDRSL